MIEFKWQQVGGPGVTPPSLTAPMLTFVPPSPGSYVFKLAVSDGLDSSTAIFIATVYTPLAIDSSAILPSGREKRGYSARLLASGGVLPITWRVVAGVLPPGLSLSEDGLLSGTPQAKGQFQFTAEVGDRVGTTLLQTLSLKVSPATVLLAPRG
ncbi:MAG TPA: putative Ig domain-containing protein [Thermoanaerobaculia bacterium]